jgi:hypothetical protein
MSDVAIPLSTPNGDGFHRTAFGTVADGTALTRGTLMVLSADPNTIVAHSAANEIPVGILLQDKAANDGTTRVAVALDGDWDMVADGSVTLGQLVVPGAAVNDVKGINDTMISNKFINQIVGICLETASDNEVVRVRVRMG